MNRPVVKAMLFSVAMVVSKGAICSPSNPDPSDKAVTNVARQPAFIRVIGNRLQHCEILEGSKNSICRSAQLPAHYGEIGRSAIVQPVAGDETSSPALRASPVGDNEPDGFPPNPFALLFDADGRKANLCVYDLSVFRCAQIAAPIPQGVTANVWSMPDGYTALTFVRSPGVSGTPDRSGRAARRFHAAFNVAMKAIQASMSGGHVGAQSSATVNQESVWGSSGGDSGSSGGGDIPVVEIHAPAPAPIEIDAIPMVPVEGIVDIGIDARPELPPREENESLAEVLNPCVVSPIVTVCVRDKRPPPPVQEPSLPRGRTPWFPQSWCDSVHALCTEGQEPRDNDRGPNSSTSGKTRAELDEICVFLNRVEIDQCKVTYPPKRKYREFLVCKEDADQRMFACFRTASQLTDNGAHPAP